jgi:hypothetical protein
MADTAADPRQARCPNCRLLNQVAPVTRLGPDEPGLQELFAGTLNRIVCAACKTTFRVDVPVLFRDEERHTLIFLPAADEAGVPLTPEEAETHLAAILRQLPAAAAGRGAPTCRLVLSHRQLVEKIAMLRQNLDDRLVEFVKYQLYLRRERDLDPVRKELFYDFSAPEADRLAFIVFDRESGKPCAAAHIALDVYRDLASAFLSSDELQAELARLFPGHYVWAAAQF